MRKYATPSGGPGSAIPFAMSDNQLRVLVVGASGMLGAKIVRELSVGGRADIRATVREGSKPEALAKLRELGVEVVNADLSDQASLDRACEGVHTVISAVQGLRETIVDGQTRLLRAAEKAKTARMIPSDYSADLFKVPDGDNRNMNLRREFNDRLDASSVRGTSVLNGAFMEMVQRGFLSPDKETRVLRFWGDPDQPMDFTSTDDTAKYVAAAAVDEGAGRQVKVAGETLSIKGIAAVFEQLHGKPVRTERSGSIEDLAAQIKKLHAADTRADDPANAFPLWQQLQYVHNMESGVARLEPLDNARYPSIEPQKLIEFLRGSGV